jgi:hypothetical protein
MSDEMNSGLGIPDVFFENVGQRFLGGLGNGLLRLWV